MEIIFYSKDGKGVISIEDEIINIDMNRDTDLYRRIIRELEIGIPQLEEFKNKGIPGKIKKYRPYKNQEDILKLLRSLKKQFYIYYIIPIKKGNHSPREIIDIEELKLRKILENDSCIREFDDRYEYCIIKDYEEKYEDFQCDSIQIGDIFVQILTIREKKFIVSIDFSKEKFDLTKIISWLGYNTIKMMGEDENYVKNAHRVINGVEFKGIPIILYEKGNKNLVILKENLTEVTETFTPHKFEVNINNSKEIYRIKPKMNIIVNGIEIDYIPEISIDLTKDLLVSNGQIVVASYVGDYFGCIGYFDEKGDDLPVAWIHEASEVYINIYWENNQRIVVIEYDYDIDIEKLLG